MKRAILLAALALALCSCGIGRLSPQPPKTVTEPQAVVTYNRAVGGDIAALRTIADYYAKGTHGFPRSRDKVLSCKLLMAEMGDVKAQSEIGRAYLHGMGCSQNDAQARRWLSLAAEQGDAQAQRSLHQLDIKAHNAGVIRNNVRGIEQEGEDRANKIRNAPMRTPVYILY